MFVNIDKISPLITESFIKYLVKILRRLILSKCKKDKLEQINKYLKDVGVIHTAQEIIIDGVKRIKYKEFENYFCIYMTEDSFLPNEKTSTYNLCKMIDSGNIDKKPSLIFSESFQEIKRDIKKYFDMYCFIPF